MNDFLTWNDSWRLGIDELDADHREMVRLMNALIGLRAAPSPQARERLDALMTHIRAHFEREEAFLRAIDYPGYVGHQREHTMQMAEFTDLGRCMDEGAAACVDEQTVQSIKNWFLNHVIAEDRLYADFFFRVRGGRVPPHGPSGRS